MGEMLYGHEDGESENTQTGWDNLASQVRTTNVQTPSAVSDRSLNAKNKMVAQAHEAVMDTFLENRKDVEPQRTLEIDKYPERIDLGDFLLHTAGDTTGRFTHEQTLDSVVSVFESGALLSDKQMNERLGKSFANGGNNVLNGENYISLTDISVLKTPGGNYDTRGSAFSSYQEYSRGVTFLIDRRIKNIRDNRYDLDADEAERLRSGIVDPYYYAKDVGMMKGEMQVKDSIPVEYIVGLALNDDPTHQDQPEHNRPVTLSELRRALLERNVGIDLPVYRFDGSEQGKFIGTTLGDETGPYIVTGEIRGTSPIMAQREKEIAYLDAEERYKKMNPVKKILTNLGRWKFGK